MDSSRLCLLTSKLSAPVSRALDIAALLAVVLVCPVLAHGGETRGALAASLGSGVDTNPLRIVGDGSTDGFISLNATAKGRVEVGEDVRLQGRCDLGARKFFRQVDEDVAVQQLQGDATWQLGQARVGADVAGKWRLSRGGARDYLDGAGDVFFDWSFAPSLSARFGAGGRGFRWAPDDNESFAAPQAAASLRWLPVRRHAMTIELSGAMPFYRGFARAESGTLLPDRRRDSLAGLHVGYAYRGPVAAQVGYTFTRVGSNSFGEASERHRIEGAATIRLPWRLYLSAQAAWQQLRYPDGVFFSQDLLLLDDEAESSVGAKIAFAVSEELDLEARWFASWIALPPTRTTDGIEQAGIHGSRQTGFLGVALRR